MKQLLAGIMALAVIGCSQEVPVERLGSADGCSPLGRECSVVAGTRTVSLLLPSNVVPLTRFPVAVRLQGLQAREVKVEFTMREMDMGINRFALRNGADTWAGEVILPVCTAGRVDWIATVEAVTENDRVVQAQFVFETGR